MRDTDRDQIYSALARMREAMLNAHPEHLTGSVACPLECVLNLEKFQKELLSEIAQLRDPVPPEEWRDLGDKLAQKQMGYYARMGHFREPVVALSFLIEGFTFGWRACMKRIANPLLEKVAGSSLGEWIARAQAAEQKSYELSIQLEEAAEKVARFEAFVVRVKNSSTCGATCLVAGQVLEGHDVREQKD